MRRTIFSTFLILAACTFDATGLGDHAESDGGSCSSGSSGFTPDDKKPSADESSSSSSSGGDESSSSDTSSSSGTGEPTLPPVTYALCKVNADCGDDPSDLCLAGVCSRTCITDAECRPTPPGFTGPSYCPPKVLLCLMPCLVDMDCLPGQRCRELGQDDIWFCAL